MSFKRLRRGNAIILTIIILEIVSILNKDTNVKENKYILRKLEDFSSGSNYYKIDYIKNNVTGTGDRLMDAPYKALCLLMNCETGCCIGDIDGMNCGTESNCKKYNEYKLPMIISISILVTLFGIIAFVLLFLLYYKKFKLSFKKALLFTFLSLFVITIPYLIYFASREHPNLESKNNDGFESLSGKKNKGVKTLLSNEKLVKKGSNLEMREGDSNNNENKNNYLNVNKKSEFHANSESLTENKLLKKDNQKIKEYKKLHQNIESYRMLGEFNQDDENNILDNNIYPFTDKNIEMTSKNGIGTNLDDLNYKNYQSNNSQHYAHNDRDNIVNSNEILSKNKINKMRSQNNYDIIEIQDDKKESYLLKDQKNDSTEIFPQIRDYNHNLNASPNDFLNNNHGKISDNVNAFYGPNTGLKSNNNLMNKHENILNKQQSDLKDMNLLEKNHLSNESNILNHNLNNGIPNIVDPNQIFSGLENDNNNNMFNYENIMDAPCDKPDPNIAGENYYKRLSNNMSINNLNLSREEYITVNDSIQNIIKKDHSQYSNRNEDNNFSNNKNQDNRRLNFNKSIEEEEKEKEKEEEEKEEEKEEEEEEEIEGKENEEILVGAIYRRKVNMDDESSKNNMQYNNHMNNQLDKIEKNSHPLNDNEEFNNNNQSVNKGDSPKKSTDKLSYIENPALNSSKELKNKPGNNEFSNENDIDNSEIHRNEILENKVQNILNKNVFHNSESQVNEKLIDEIANNGNLNYNDLLKHEKGNDENTHKNHLPISEYTDNEGINTKKDNNEHIKGNDLHNFESKDNEGLNHKKSSTQNLKRNRSKNSQAEAIDMFNNNTGNHQIRNKNDLQSSENNQNKTHSQHDSRHTYQNLNYDELEESEHDNSYLNINKNLNNSADFHDNKIGNNNSDIAKKQLKEDHHLYKVNLNDNSIIHNHDQPQKPINISIINKEEYIEEKHHLSKYIEVNIQESPRNFHKTKLEESLEEEQNEQNVNLKSQGSKKIIESENIEKIENNDVDDENNINIKKSHPISINNLEHRDNNSNHVISNKPSHSKLDKSLESDQQFPIERIKNNKGSELEKRNKLNNNHNKNKKIKNNENVDSINKINLEHIDKDSQLINIEKNHSLDKNNLGNKVDITNNTNKKQFSKATVHDQSNYFNANDDQLSLVEGENSNFVNKNNINEGSDKFKEIKEENNNDKKFYRNHDYSDNKADHHRDEGDEEIQNLKDKSKNAGDRNYKNQNSENGDKMKTNIKSQKSNKNLIKKNTDDRLNQPNNGIKINDKVLEKEDYKDKNKIENIKNKFKDPKENKNTVIDNISNNSKSEKNDKMQNINQAQKNKIEDKDKISPTEDKIKNTKPKKQDKSFKSMTSAKGGDQKNTLDKKTIAENLKKMKTFPLLNTLDEAGMRSKLFDKFDNGNGILSLSEVEVGVRNVFRFNENFIKKDVIKKAFHAARSLGKEKSNMSNDFVEKHEFRTFLFFLSKYAECYEKFNQIDRENDKKLNYDEFEEALPLFAQWNIQVDDAKSEFKQIDFDNSGTVNFDEFANWAINKTLQSDDYDNFNEYQLLKQANLEMKKNKK